VVGPESDDEALARVAAALGVRPVAKKTPAAKAPAKKIAKKAQSRKRPAKKIPAKKAAKKSTAATAERKRAVRKRAAAAPDVPDEVAEIQPPPEPAELMVLDLEAPAARAHALFVQGVPWPEIALRTGYASEQSASTAVAIYLQRGAIAADLETSKTRASIALETTTLVKSAFFDRAMLGDKDAAMIVLRANEDYYKMAGLEKTDLTVNSRQTIVITGGPDMAHQLQEAAERIDEQRRRAEDAVDAEEVSEE